MDLTTYAELAVRLVNTASYSEDNLDRLATMDGLRDLVTDREHLSSGATRRDLEALRGLRAEFRKIFAACAEGNGEDVAARLNSPSEYALLVAWAAGVSHFVDVGFRELHRNGAADSPDFIAAGYHVRNMPPKVAGVCDACGGELVQRADDTPETVRTRLAVFRDRTAPLIEWYGSRQALIRIDGDGGADNVTARIVRALQ